MLGIYIIQSIQHNLSCPRWLHDMSASSAVVSAQASLCSAASGTRVHRQQQKFAAAKDCPVYRCTKVLVTTAVCNSPCIRFVQCGHWNSQGAQCLRIWLSGWKHTCMARQYVVLPSLWLSCGSCITLCSCDMSVQTVYKAQNGTHMRSASTTDQ